MKRAERGFTLVEILVSSTILLVILVAAYTLILATQRTHLTEGRKIDMTQASRALEQMLFDDIRSSGSVLSLLYTPVFLGKPAPFTGIYPLNNSTYPDGMILASGNDRGVTSSTADFTPGATSLNVVRVYDPDDAGQSAWFQNDTGIIFRESGYYVFRVTATPAPGATQLAIRASPVYYSGLLKTANYDDLSETHQGVYGNDPTSPYPAGSPVIKVDYFNIYLVKSEANGSRTLTLTYDCDGVADVLASPSISRAVPVVANIEDIQYEYVSEDNEYWASKDTSLKNYDNPCLGPMDTKCLNFIDQFRFHKITSVKVYVLVKTEEERNKHKGTGLNYDKPRMGDVAKQCLPIGRFHYNYMKFEIFIRNYNNVL